MKIVIAKPESDITGGFELVLRHIVRALQNHGHELRVASLPVSSDERSIRGVDIPELVWAEALEFFTYASLLDRFSRLDVSDADLVITTQPGSWGVEHPRKLAIFYHHHRVAYDLEAPFIKGRLADPELHRTASRLLRELDGPSIESIAHFLVPSRTVASRLELFNNVQSVRTSPYYAGPHHLAEEVSITGEHVLCVSRTEFAKRTELFVAAAHSGFGAPAHLVGSGGRLPFLRQYALDLSAGVERETEPWWSKAEWTADDVSTPAEPVEIHGWLEDGLVSELYGKSAVVVAPAFNEDYGLTVLEAMSHGKPVVVCDDGGGLVELIEDGKTGLVVPPHADEVAKAVRSLVDDVDRAAEMGAAARLVAAEYTWDRAASQLIDGVQAVSVGS